MSVGRVGRPHGLDGSFYVTGALPRLLSVGVRVSVGGRLTEVVRRAGTEERPILRVDGISDRSAAEGVRGAQLSVQRADAPQLGPEEWWAWQLEGCAVSDGARHIGVVNRLIELPSCEALEVSVAPPVGEPGISQTLLIPMVKDAIRSIDIERARVDVDMGFVDVDMGFVDVDMGFVGEEP